MLTACIPGSRLLEAFCKEKRCFQCFDIGILYTAPSEQNRVFASQFHLESLNLNGASLKNRKTQDLACNEPFYLCLCFLSCYWLKGTLT